MLHAVCQMFPLLTFPLVPTNCVLSLSINLYAYKYKHTCVYIYILYIKATGAVSCRMFWSSVKVTWHQTWCCVQLIKYTVRGSVEDILKTRVQYKQELKGTILDASQNWSNPKRTLSSCQGTASADSVISAHSFVQTHNSRKMPGHNSVLTSPGFDLNTVSCSSVLPGRYLIPLIKYDTNEGISNCRTLEMTSMFDMKHGWTPQLWLSWRPVTVCIVLHGIPIQEVNELPCSWKQYFLYYISQYLKNASGLIGGGGTDGECVHPPASISLPLQVLTG